MPITKPARGTTGWDVATDAAIDHANATGNPHGTTKADLGLGLVVNLPPADLPLSVAAQAALDGKVPTTQRGPIGGVAAATYGTSVTPDAAAAVHLRYVATGNMTVSPPVGGVDGQRVLIEVQGSGAARTVTFTAGIATSQAVPGRVFTVQAGTSGFFVLLLLGATWRLVAAEPQDVTTAATGQWLPADHGLLAWTADPIQVNGGMACGSSFPFHSAFKLDQAATISIVWCAVQTAGVGLTANRCYVGIYDAAGARQAVTGDQSAVWNTTGVKNMSLTSAVALSPGTYYALLVSASTTTEPNFAALITDTLPHQVGRTTSTLRVGYTATANTSLPTTKPNITNTAGINAIWFGFS